MIILDDPNTWGDNFNKLIKNKIKKISKEISEEQIDYKNYPLSRYSSKVYTPTYNDVINDLSKELINYTINAVHCSRIMDLEILRNEGIKRLNVKNQCEYALAEIKKYFDKNEYDFIYQTIMSGHSSFEDGRQNMISFVLNRKLLMERGCHDFYAYFGGEAFRKIIESKFDTKTNDKILYVLHQLGKPCNIEAEIPIKDINNNGHDLIARKMVSHYLSKRSDYCISSIEGRISRNISPKEIINIYEVTDIMQQHL